MLPFGQLVRFGTIRFSGLGALSAVKSAWPLEYSADYDVGLVNVGSAYPFDSQGVQPAPFRGTPTITYEYVIMSSAGLSEAKAFRDLRTKWNAIYSRLQGTYTWTQASGASVANVSGQKGDLVVKDEDPSVGTFYRATARIMRPSPWKLEKGQPSVLVVELPFLLLSDFEPVVSV